MYDVRQPLEDTYPVDPSPLLQNKTFMCVSLRSLEILRDADDVIREKIGAKHNWTSSSNEVFFNFFSTGDDVRNFTPDLEAVINAGVSFTGGCQIVLSSLTCRLAGPF